MVRAGGRGTSAGASGRDSRRKTRAIQIRVTPEQKERLKAACAKEGATLTAWLVRLGLERAKRVAREGAGR